MRHLWQLRPAVPKKSAGEETWMEQEGQEQAHSEENNRSRREFLKKSVYVTPAILTLAVTPGYAKAGSEKPGTWPPPGTPPGSWPPPPPPVGNDPSSWAAWWEWLKK